MFAIAVVAVTAVGSLWNESEGNIVAEVFTCIFGVLTICAALYWSTWCLDRIDKKDKKVVAE
jgi:hypothetical protein